jgi:DNA-binding CsgD family transcriptional regulator
MPIPVADEIRSSEFDERVSALLSQLRTFLDSRPDDVAGKALLDEVAALPVSVAKACADRLLDRAHAAELMATAADLQSTLRDAVTDAHSDTFGRINEAFASTARCATPAELVQLAPVLLCEACNFDRAMISAVRGSTWVPTAVHVAVGADDHVNRALVSTITTLEVPLTSSLIETEILRRRTSMLVDGTAVERHPSHVLAGLSASRAYIAAPIVIAERVAGFLHADTFTSRRSLTDADRVALQAFADLFGLLYERAAMAERLLQQQDTIRTALTSAADSVAELGPNVGHLVRADLRAADVPAHGDTRPTAERHDVGTLTTREWEILGLLATGATNGQIAAALVVSESTIKSHVKRILRKLPAANRAEAVYRYTRMTSERSRVS